jgi:hypothetical protein
MIETLNVTHRFPTHKRARSTSSTSGSSVPRTPIVDYDEFHRVARLGADFAVIKMGDRTKGARNIKVKTPAVLSWEQSSSSSDIAEVLHFSSSYCLMVNPSTTASSTSGRTSPVACQYLLNPKHPTPTTSPPATTNEY